MSRLATFVASIMLVIGAFASIGPATLVNAQDGGYAPDAEEWAFVDLINGYRGSLGLAPLSINYELGAAADYHSADMAANNYFDHYLFDGTDPGTNIQNFGYSGFPYGENIAAGMATAQEVMIAWQNSPDHDVAMRNPAFTEIGIGRAYSDASYYGWYWTANFGGGEGVQTAPEPVLDAVAEPVTDPLPEPIVSPDTTTLTGLVETSESTTTYEEPPTVVTNDGGMVEMQQNAVNADGDSARATGDSPVADGTGDTVIYGDINTGGVLGETVVYEPPALTVTGEGVAPAPVYTETTYIEPVYTDATSVEPVAAAPVYTDPTFSETTTTNISMDDGNGRAIG